MSPIARTGATGRGSFAAVHIASGFALLAACGNSAPAPHDASSLDAVDVAASLDTVTPDLGVDHTTLDAADVVDASLPSDAMDRPAPTPLDPGEMLFAQNFVAVTSFSDVNSASYHCLAAASAYRRYLEGAAFDPTFIAGVQTSMRVAADYLISSEPFWGNQGWGLKAAWDAFQDGTTNSVTTVYAFETGLAAWCLAEAGDLTGSAQYTRAAGDALTRYRTAFVGAGSGYTLADADAGYFWYSLSTNDVGRMVKNTNIEMAMASLAYDLYNHDSAARATAVAAADAQMQELTRFTNDSYLGRYDPHYVAGVDRWDDHNSFESYVMFHVGEVLSRTDYEGAAHTQYTGYAAHVGGLLDASAGSLNDVAYAACHFARIDSAAANTCAAWFAQHGHTANGAILMGLVMRY